MHSPEVAPIPRTLRDVMSAEHLSSLPILSLDTASKGGGCSSPPLPATRRLPPWLRRNLEPGGGHGETARLVEELGLETVCSSAKGWASSSVS